MYRKIKIFVLLIPNTWLLSQRHFLKRQLPKGIFPSATSQMCNFPSRNFSSLSLAAELGPPWPVLAVALGPLLILAAALDPHCSLRRLRRPNLTFGKLPLENCTFGKLPLGKLMLGKSPLGKCKST